MLLLGVDEMIVTLVEVVPVTASGVWRSLAGGNRPQKCKRMESTLSCCSSPIPPTLETGVWMDDSILHCYWAKAFCTRRLGFRGLTLATKSEHTWSYVFLHHIMRRWFLSLSLLESPLTFHVDLSASREWFGGICLRLLGHVTFLVLIILTNHLAFGFYISLS